MLKYGIQDNCVGISIFKKISTELFHDKIMIQSGYNSSPRQERREGGEREARGRQEEQIAPVPQKLRNFILRN